MTTSSRPYQGASAQDRIGARRRRLLDAAFELMAAGRWQPTTIDRLCRRVKLNKRYFYESFANLDALADAVVDELAAGLLAVGFATAAAAQAQSLPTDALAREVMKAVLGWLVEDPRRARVLFGAGDNPRALAHRKTVIRSLARELSAFGHAYHGAPGPQPVAQAGAALLVGGSIEALLSWLDGEIPMPFEEFVDDVAGFWVAVGTQAVAAATLRLERAAKPAKRPARAKRRARAR